MKKIIFFVFLFFFEVSCEHLSDYKDVWIKNAQNESIYVQAEGLQNTDNHKLAIMQHGLASSKEHPAILMAKKAFLNNGYVVITFDSRYSLGKGNNDVQKVSLSTFEEDLKTVLEWTKKENFYHEPFALVGHSLGGASVLKYSQNYPDEVDTLVLIAPIIGGDLWEKTCFSKLSGFCQTWKKNGTYEYTDPKSRKKAIVPYGVITTSRDYNAFLFASQIKAKTLLIGTQNDVVVTVEDVEKIAKLFKNAQNKTIVLSSHNFEKRQNQEDLYQEINHFLVEK